MPAKLGIIAGGGNLPIRLVAACRADEREFFVLGLSGHADPADFQGLPQAWIRLGEAGKGMDLLKENGVGDLVMAGRVRRPSLRDLKPDWRTARFFARVGLLKSLGDDGLLKAVIEELEDRGFRVVGADTILGGLVAVEGQWGGVAPDAEARADIERGLQVARGLGSLDVGQAVVVQQGIVLGVEAAEGTDQLLRRCGELRRAGPGGVLVKVAKPGQERRVDLPTIGLDTIRNAVAAGLRGVVVEAGSALVVDRDLVIAAADAAGLFICGVAPDPL
jgi:DUF1009 family protein